MITITGLSTNVSENNSSVQACVNITQGSVESSDNSVYAYISTSPSTGFNSAIGMHMTTTVKPIYNSRQHWNSFSALPWLNKVFLFQGIVLRII